MIRTSTFMFRVSFEERQAITELAERLQRSQSDAVRFVVINAARQLDKFPQEISIPKSTIISQMIGETTRRDVTQTAR